jgi:hypothetical protein
MTTSPLLLYIEDNTPEALLPKKVLEEDARAAWAKGAAPGRVEAALEIEDRRV